MSTKILVKLNRVPERFKKDMLELKGILKLELHHKAKANFLNETSKFVNQYIPGEKYNNSAFKFSRTLSDTVETPIIKVYDKELKLRETIETGNLKLEQILLRIKEIDHKLSTL
jgi:hypothetical protein